MKKASLITLKLGLLIILLILAYKTQDLKEIIYLIKNINIYYFVIFFSLFLITTAMASTNLYLLLKPLDYKLSWKRIFHIDLLSIVGAFYTPGGIGGMGIIVYLMTRSGVNLKDASIVVLIDKQISGCVALFFLMIYVINYPINDISINWNMLSILIISLVVFGLSLFSKLVRKVVRGVLTRVNIYKNHVRLLILNVFLTVGIYSVNVFVYIVCFYTVGIVIPDINLIFLTYSIFMLINYLPISIGGIGVGEFTAIILWSSMGLSSEQILAGFIVMRGFALVSSLSLSGLAFFLLPNDMLKIMKKV